MKVFVPLSVAMLATCMDDSVEMVAEGYIPSPGANLPALRDTGSNLPAIRHEHSGPNLPAKLETGPRGGQYYLSKKGLKIYVDTLRSGAKKAAHGIRKAIDVCKKGVEAFKKSGCMQKCKNALGSAKKFATKVKATLKQAGIERRVKNFNKAASSIRDRLKGHMSQDQRIKFRQVKDHVRNKIATHDSSKVIAL